jgi:NADPH-dependent 2,4-dienoyl-CoA reductase/sulfur reductase-like enzyme/ferredoxin
MSGHIVIAGGGLAAQRCCETLRRAGHRGRITLVGAEPVVPYDRPPLSKEVLAGELDPGALALRPPGWYADHGIELLLGRAAAALHPERRELELRDGGVLAYDRLLIATGAEPRPLPLFDGAPNAHLLRTAADAGRLRAALRPGRRLIVVGAGFIGQEVAATGRALGVEVTVLEAMDAPLAGLLGHELGSWFADLHREEGVDHRCGVTAVGTRRDDRGRMTGVVTADGHTLPCDLVLSGVGVTPADGWLAGSGLGGGGVECDHAGRTALPDVFAAGDVARPYDAFAGAHGRSEHWGGCRSAGRRRRPRDARRPGRRRAALELLERPVRAARPVRRSGLAGREPRARRRGHDARLRRRLAARAAAGRRAAGRAPARAPGDAEARPGRAGTRGGDGDMTYVPHIDEGACAAHGDCEAVAPDVFRIDDIATVIGTGPDDLIVRAAESCPSVAITVVDDETGETVYP